MTTPAAPDATWKRGDLRPSIRAQLTTNAGPVDLTNMTSALFVMLQVADLDGNVPVTPKYVEGAAVVVTGPQPDGTTLTAADGWLEYAWAAGNTDTVGDYEAEWETLWPPLVAGGVNRPQTFPQETVHTIRIVPDRGGA